MKGILASLLIFVSTAFAGPNDIIKDGLTLEVSRASVDMIIYYEVGGKDYYNAKFTKPMVPAWQTTSSGVTVGFGFDAGYNSKEQIRKALQGICSEEEIAALQSVSGMKGKNAYYNGLPKVRNKIVITWEEADKIFMRDSLVRFSKQTSDAFRLSSTQLHPHSNGALISLVYNRGSLIDGTDRRKEMLLIKNNIRDRQYSKIPANIRSMKRLWSYTKLKGLHLRRDSEASMFERGLNNK